MPSLHRAPTSIIPTCRGWSLLENVCSVDATNEVGRLGRLVNHSRTEANVSTKVMELDGKPHLC